MQQLKNSHIAGFLQPFAILHYSCSPATESRTMIELYRSFRSPAGFLSCSPFRLLRHSKTNTFPVSIELKTLFVLLLQVYLQVTMYQSVLVTSALSCLALTVFILFFLFNKSHEDVVRKMTNKLDDLLKKIDDTHMELSKKIDDTHMELSKKIDDTHMDLLDVNNSLSSQIMRNVASNPSPEILSAVANTYERSIFQFNRQAEGGSVFTSTAYAIKGLSGLRNATYILSVRHALWMPPEETHNGIQFNKTNYNRYINMSAISLISIDKIVKVAGPDCIIVASGIASDGTVEDWVLLQCKGMESVPGIPLPEKPCVFHPKLSSNMVSLVFYATRVL